MLSFLKSTILWKQTFDAEFKMCMPHLRKFNCKALRETRDFWRDEEGRARDLSSGEAVFRAIELFANSYYDENKDRVGSDAEFEQLAFALNFAAPNEDKYGDYVEPLSFLSERWVMYLEAYHKHNSSSGAKRNRKA